jgi:hypothetical protein
MASPRSTASFRTWCVLPMLAFAFLSAPALAREFPLSATQVPVAPVKVKEVLTAAQARLGTGLAAVILEPKPLEAAVRNGYRVKDGRIQVHTVVADPADVDLVVGWLEERGATLVSSADTTVQAHVAPDLLEALAELPAVEMVRRPIYIREPDSPRDQVTATAGPVGPVAAMTGPIVSEALPAINAPAWHAAGWTGQNVKVGVIDSGFGNYDQLYGTELPVAGKVHTAVFGDAQLNSGQHGLGCAEVITDVAPGVELYLAAYGGTDVDIANAKAWMVTNGVKVVSMSQGWLSWGPGDGSIGIATGAVNSFVSGGGVWVNSAGNSRLAHWQGTWRDDNSNGYLNFDSTYEINYVMKTDRSDVVWIDAGKDVYAALVWNQWTSPATDLDFYLYRYDGTNTPTVVASSEDQQSGQAGQLPTEDISFTTTEAGYYGFGIKLYAGPTNVQIEFFNRFDGNPLQFNVQDGSITPPGDATGAITAAALDALTPFALESYSSRGPNNGAGGALTGGAIKPDIAGYAVVSTSAYGPRADGGFSGTSAACPHVAGAAALAWSGYPTYTNAQVRTLLESRAIDMGTGGKDNDYGVGRLNLGSPPAGACTAPGVPTGLASNRTTTCSGQAYTLSWSAVTGAANYTIEVATDAAFTNKLTLNPSTFTGTSVNITITGTHVGPLYNHVRANASCGASSAYSSAIQVSYTGNNCSTPTYTKTYYVSGIARTPGVSPAYWYSDLGILNHGTASAQVQVRFFGNATPAPFTATISAGQQRTWPDVLSSGFGMTGTDVGVIVVESTTPVTVLARTFSKVRDACTNKDRTDGQSYPGYEVARALSNGQVGYLPNLRSDDPYGTGAGYRTNGEAVNVGTTPIDVQWTFYTNTRALITTVTRTGIQSNRRVGVTAALPAGHSAAFAEVRVLTAGGKAICFASVVDGTSTDPTTVDLVIP